MMICFVLMLILAKRKICFTRYAIQFDHCSISADIDADCFFFYCYSICQQTANSFNSLCFDVYFYVNRSMWWQNHRPISYVHVLWESWMEGEHQTRLFIPLILSLSLTLCLSVFSSEPKCCLWFWFSVIKKKEENNRKKEPAILLFESNKFVVELDGIANFWGVIDFVQVKIISFVYRI